MLRRGNKLESMHSFSRFLISAICLISFPLFLFSQNTPSRWLSAPFVKSGRELKNPWTGAFNAPQFSRAFINDDSLPDLFIFDRSDDKVLTYINDGSGSDTCYVYSPEYESIYPEISHWALIRDYNLDGIDDIFCRANGGIMVYKGKRIAGQLHFDLVNPLLSFPFNNISVNIYCSLVDIPAIEDINGDGDLDVLTFPIIGTTVEYYENQTIESAMPYDSLPFAFTTDCWGGFLENGLGNTVTFGACKSEGSPVPDITQEEGARDGNHTLMAFDMEPDGDKDLFIGATFYNNVLYLRNCGTNQAAQMCYKDSLFPRYDNTLYVDFFPSAFHLDVDNNNREDILFSSNLRVGGADRRNVFRYEYTPGNGDSTIRFVSDSFLTGNQLDFGTDSKPVFFDYNNDGKLDIVVGIYGFYQGNSLPLKSQVAVLENIGTPTQPRFNERTLNYSNLGQFNLQGLSPTFGDLTGDGKPDMIVGDATGQIHFFENAGTSMPSYPVMTEPFFDSIDVGLNAIPFLFDVNNDSLLDLVVGAKTGRVLYYWNLGTAQTPLFKRDSVNNFFGQVDVKITGFPSGMAHPFIRKQNDSLILYVGSDRGWVFRYLIDTTLLRSGAFAVLDSNFLRYDVGARATLSIADINNDGYADYAVGEARGGVLLFSDTLLDNPPVVISTPERRADSPPLLRLYPNPAGDQLNLWFNRADRAEYRLYDALGRIWQQGVIQERRQLNLQDLPSGFYWVEVKPATGERQLQSFIRR